MKKIFNRKYSFKCFLIVSLISVFSIGYAKTDVHRYVSDKPIEINKDGWNIIYDSELDEGNVPMAYAVTKVMWTPTGWLVLAYSMSPSNNPSYNQSLTFVPDKGHDWHPKAVLIKSFFHPKPIHFPSIKTY